MIIKCFEIYDLGDKQNIPAAEGVKIVDIKREIKEELDADIDVEDYLGVIEYQYPKFTLHLHLYICSIISGNLTMLEAEGEKWLELNELDSLNWLPADVGALKLIRKHFQTKKIVLKQLKSL